MSLERLERVLEQADSPHVRVTLRLWSARKELELDIGPDQRDFIPDVAIQTAGIEGYRTVDELAQELLDDLATAAIRMATADKPAAPKKRAR